jgi:hypothetical protein
VQYLSTTTANPPAATIAAGATAAVSIGTQYAWTLDVVGAYGLLAERGELTLTGTPTTLSAAPDRVVAEPEGYFIEGVDVTMAYTPVWSLVSTLGALAASYSDMTVAASTTYRYRIVAVNLTASVASNEVLVSTFASNTDELIAEPAVYGVTGATSGATFATDRLTASAVAYAATGLAATLENPALVFETVQTLGVASTYSDFGLDPATGYVYRIVAINAGGSTASNIIVVYTPAITADNPITASGGTLIKTGALAATGVLVPILKGTHATTGTLATFLVLHILGADSRDLTLTGAPTTLAAAGLVLASPGAHALTGVSATLEHTFVGQQAYPVSDITDGSWTPSSGVHLYATIDDPSDAAPADADYMRVVDPENDEAVVELGDVQPPGAGDVYLLVRSRKV